MGGGYPNLGIVVDFIIRSLDLSRLFLFYMKKFSHFNKFSNAQNIKRAGLAPARQPVDKTLVLRPNRPFPVEKVFPGGSARSVRLKGKKFNLKASGGFTPPAPSLTSPPWQTKGDPCLLSPAWAPRTFADGKCAGRFSHPMRPIHVIQAQIFQNHL